VDAIPPPSTGGSACRLGAAVDSVPRPETPATKRLLGGSGQMRASARRVVVGEQLALTGDLGAGYLVNEPDALARV
jgi:hypothetical protein